MRPSHVITAGAVLPPELASLEPLARNLGWTWDEAGRLFARLDPALWDQTNHNPIELLRLVDQSRLSEATADPTYRADLAAAAERLQAIGLVEEPEVAYFSFEFGLTESLPTYAGGLGVLAGDHLKAASDRGIPLAGVGLFYREGYFRQFTNEAGWQVEHYPDHDPASLPLELMRQSDGSPRILQLDYPGLGVAIRIWRARVGRVPLYLLDADFDDNDPADRELTRRLYGGDRELRLRQEILLGIGGLRAIRALGMKPKVFHLNEGHAAFLGLERIRELIVDLELSFEEARVAAGPGLIFTTHTPVPAGNDAFSPGMLDQYFADYYRDLRVTRSEFLNQGRQNPLDESEPFSMTVLALRLCGTSNSVSKLHGAVARRMWQAIWPSLPAEAVPIGSVTNGVHMPSWLAPELSAAYSPEGQLRDISDGTLWARHGDMSDEALWLRHQALRRRLIDFARERLLAQLRRRAAGPTQLSWASKLLDPDALTIGFARRFAGYKRATLLLSDPERLARLVNQAHRPLQLIFSGKSHPHDDPGKELIRELIEVIDRPDLRSRVIFLEDYDLNVARHLVQGADVWLNTPRRPLEASGTSGMKAVANGALHLSTLDGWWDEAFQPGLGWAIGDRREYQDLAEQDEVDRCSLFELLEREIVPLFYEQDSAGFPRGWLAMMRASMSSLTPEFSTERMVTEYDQRFYRPARALAERLAGPDPRPARELAGWLARVDARWPNVLVEKVLLEGDSVSTGTPLQVGAVVQLDGLEAAEVDAALLMGKLDPSGEMTDVREIPLKPSHDTERGACRYESGPILLETSGSRGLLIRLTPRHGDLTESQMLSRARWST